MLKVVVVFCGFVRTALGLAFLVISEKNSRSGDDHDDHDQRNLKLQFLCHIPYVIKSGPLIHARMRGSFKTLRDGRALELLVNEVPHPAELVQDFFGNFLIVRRVRKRPVQADAVSGKRRAGLFGVVADRDDIVKMPTQVFPHVLRALAGNVDPDLLHHADRGLIDPGRPGPGAVRLEPVAAVMPEDAFGHLGATGIARAQNENFGFQWFSKKRRSAAARRPPAHWLAQ